MLTKLATFRGTDVNGDPLAQVFNPGDKLKVAGTLMPQVKDWLANYRPQPNKIAILVNALGSSEFWGQNVNGDIFPENGLLHDCRKHPSEQHPYDDFIGKTLPPYGYWTFKYAHPFVHHRNKDPSRAFGEVVLCAWNPRMHRVELVVILDTHLAMQHGAQHIIDRILAGDYPDVSMGCRVPYDVCTICKHKSKTRHDYCSCIKHIGMGRILDDGRQIGVINLHPRFFDISFVFIGADKTAKMMCKLASGLWVPQSVADAQRLYDIPEDANGLVKAACGKGTCKECLKPCKVAGQLYFGPTHGWRDDPHWPIDHGKDPKERKLIEGYYRATGKDRPLPAYLKGRRIHFTKNAWVMTEEGQKILEQKAVSTEGTPRLDIGVRKRYEGVLALDRDGKKEMIGVLDPDTMDKVIAGLKTKHPDHPFLEKLKTAMRKKAVNADFSQFEEIVPTSDQKTIPGERSAVAKAKDQPRDTTGEDDIELMMSPEDQQEGQSVSSSGDGIMRTNYEDAVTDDEKRAFADILKIAEQGTVAMLSEATRQVKIGPPPKPNRKEYPFVGTLNFRGIQINIENKVGDVREGQNRAGKKWRTVMKFPYGEFDKVKATGMDGDKLDVYVGPFRNAPNVHIVHQNDPATGKYDEDKVMLGFRNDEETKQAYLSQYDNPKFFRSITTMAFPLFKKSLLGGELDGEKVAYSALMEKVAEELKLEDLFEAKAPRRRQRTWRNKVTGKETHVTGSGMGSFEKAKTASVEKIAEPLTPHELLKVSDSKVGNIQKWSDIVKQIGPSAAVGKVTPLTDAAEPDIPKDTLNEMGEMPMEKALATPSLMGMVLRPREFQRIMLTGSGHKGLADTMDDAGAVFKPGDGEEAPCSSLSSGDMAPSLMKALLPFLGDRSYYGPVLRRRIIRITICAPKPEAPEREMESPLLSKVASAYNWYRREQMKLAADGPGLMAETPELHSALYGLDDSNLFGKESAATSQKMLTGVAKEIGRIDPKTLGVVLGSIPITMMYSAHLRGKRRRDEEMGVLKNLIADHPWIASIGIAAGLREIMKSPQAQQLVDEMFQAGKRVWRGKGSQQAAKAVSL